MKTRNVIEQMPARPASDGDGVKLLRVFGGPKPERFDPFLLLDEFGSESADDYIGGFPPHPHRGFSTVTYMLQGKMEHRDHMENVGLLGDGDVQWMTAGSGVIHSEMPKQTEGKMRGFQLWLNLPAEKKMQVASYEDVHHSKIPTYTFDSFCIKALSGKSAINGQEVKGYFNIDDTNALYFDIEINANAEINIPIEDDYTVLAYVYEGAVGLGETQTSAQTQVISRMNTEGTLKVKNLNNDTSRFLVLAGKPLHEPIAQHGPFVMNTPDEIEQAIHDYRNGTLVENQHSEFGTT